MPRPVPVLLAIPQPCAESWAAMTAAPGGRHCAACQKTVVDFTQLSDAEILAHLRQAAGGEVCGRLYADQLHRPLRPASPPTSASRWRAWLALLLAAWGASRAEAAAGPAPHPSHHAPPRATPRQRSGTLAARYVQGTVRDSVSDQPLVGVAVFLLGENRQATTDANGWFGLRLSPRRPRGGRKLVLHFAGYQSATMRVPTSIRPTPLAVALAREHGATDVEVVARALPTRRDWGPSGSVATIEMRELQRQSRLRTLWQRLTRPFRHAQPDTGQ